MASTEYVAWHAVYSVLVAADSRPATARGYYATRAAGDTQGAGPLAGGVDAPSYDARTVPSYKYLVGVDNEVLSADPGALPELTNGTRCIHIGYDAPSWATTFTTDLWQFLHASMFDPVLPFLVTSTRANDSKFGSRIIIGNSARSVVVRSMFCPDLGSTRSV